MTTTDAIPEIWCEWLLHNRDRGCAWKELIEQAMEQGYQLDAIKAVLSSSEVSAGSISDRSPLAGSWLQWFQAPLTQPTSQPRAWRLDTPLAQVYEIPELLSQDECREVIEAINDTLVPSTVTVGSSSYRTSRTCHLCENHSDIAALLDQRFADLLGVHPSLSEPIQGQRYDPGEYFKEHTDWFTPGTKEFDEHTRNGGQRTWTLMIYLNAVDRGGETCFKRLGRCFTPVPGLGLAWNNLQADGTPNPFTLHEAMPVEVGSKWVITKWFRAQMGRNG